MHSPFPWRARWRAVTLLARITAPPRPVDLAQRIGAFSSGFPYEGGYRVPDLGERSAVAAAVVHVLDGRLDMARRRLAAVGYTLRTLHTDGPEGSTRDVAEVAESPATHRGWGRVYIDLTHPARWSVQVPHPRSDLRTELLAAELFTNSPGGVLVLAGALRTAGGNDCADVAHRADSVFDAVCDVLVARELPAIQVHGFADASSPGHDVVVSPGAAEPGHAVRQAARLLADKGFRVCRVWEQRCGGLEGTTNVQGNKAAARGIPFLHVENSRTVRYDPASRTRIAQALAEVAIGWL